MAKPRRNPVHHRAPRKWRKSALSIVGLFVLFSAFVAVSTQRLFTSEALAQQAAHSDHERGQIHLNHAGGQTFEPLIDGSIEPESVPDNVAIRALMQTLRVPQDADLRTRERLRAQVSRVDFTDADFEILLRELGELEMRARDQQAIIEAVRPSASEADIVAIGRYVEEQKQFGLILVDHYHEILASLSPQGAENLQRHLLHVKSRIKIYPTPNMSADIN